MTEADAGNSPLPRRVRCVVLTAELVRDLSASTDIKLPPTARAKLRLPVINAPPSTMRICT